MVSCWFFVVEGFLGCCCGFFWRLCVDFRVWWLVLVVLVVGSGFGLIGSNLEVGLDFWVWSCCVGFCIWVFFFIFFGQKSGSQGWWMGFWRVERKRIGGWVVV